MNENLKRLMKQADYPAPELALRAQKLAELLIKESIKVMVENDYHGEWLGEKLKEHFGVDNLVEKSNCWCHTCRPISVSDPESVKMRLCPECGNKRCPKATNHIHACTDSNDSGQEGSIY